MKKQHMTKAVLSLLTASLVLGSPVWAAEAGSQGKNSSTVTILAAKQRFPDVPSSHWATKYITKLALLGIVEGNELGQYEPGNPVTQEQVITMLVRMLGWEEEAQQLPSFASELEVSGYAKPYLHIALEKGLINYLEELETSGAGWGTRNAAREWVAKVVVKAIGGQKEAEALEDDKTAFTDDSAISSWSRGYINQAVALKIVDGMEDGSFKPGNSVTRAEMATFLSRAGQYAETTAVSEMGIIESISQQSVVISTDLGAQSTFSLTEDTIFYGLNQTAPSTAAALKAGNKVFLVVKDDQALYAEVLEEDGQAANVLEGTLVEFDISSAQLQLSVGSKVVTAQIEIPVTIVDNNGKGMSSNALEPGYVLELRRTGSQAKYSTIVVKHIPVNKTDEGVIQSIDLSNRTLTVLESGGQTAEYPLAEQLVYTEDGAVADVTVLKARDEIGYQVSADIVTEISLIKAYEEPSESGKLVQLLANANFYLITIQNADNKPVSYNIVENPEVVISGVEGATTNDLLANDEVKVMLDDNNDVYKIIVTNRSLKTQYLNTIINFAQSSKVLTVKDADGQLLAYELSDDTTYDLNGTAATFSAIASFLTEGKLVDIFASSSTDVKQIRVVFGYEGTVIRVLPEQNELVLKVGEQQITFKLAVSTYISLLDKTSAKISDVPVGERVRLTFDGSLTSIVRIDSVRTSISRLVNKIAETRTLTFIDENQTTRAFVISTGVKIYNANQSELAIANMTLDEPYHVTYVGSSIEKIVAATATRGEVISVDAAAGRVVINELGDSVNTTLSVGTTAKVKRVGEASTAALATLNKGDRIEAVKGTDGIYVLRVAAVMERQVESYDATAKTLNILRNSLQENRSYTFHPKAKVYQGSASITPSSLVNKDNVIMYVLDSQIIELEKK